MSLGLNSLGIDSLGIESINTAAAAATDGSAAGVTLTGTSSISAGTAEGSGDAVVDGATLTGSSSLSAGAASGSAGVITVPAIKRWSGGALASVESGITVFVNDETTGDLVKKFSSQTTDGFGNLSLTDTLIVVGTWYSVRGVLSDGARFEWKFQAT